MTLWSKRPSDYNFKYREDMEIVANMVLADRCESILECAAGTGYFIKILRDKGYKGEYLGTDFTPEFIAAAAMHNPGETFTYLDLESPTLCEDDYDGIVVIGALLYFEDLESVLRNLKEGARRFLYLDLYNQFTPDGGPDNLRFSRGEMLGNQYNEAGFFAMLERLGLTVLERRECPNLDDGLPHVILKVSTL